VKDIQFAYNNYEVIAILKKRGYAISQCQWDMVKQFDNQLTEYVKNEENYSKLTVPACAFITFESDDGFGEALNYSKRSSWWANKNAKDDDGFEYVNILGVQP
jgi:hypothetical protein